MYDRQGSNSHLFIRCISGYAFLFRCIFRTMFIFLPDVFPDVSVVLIYFQNHICFLYDVFSDMSFILSYLQKLYSILSYVFSDMSLVLVYFQISTHFIQCIHRFAFSSDVFQYVTILMHFHNIPFYPMYFWVFLFIQMHI